MGKNEALQSLVEIYVNERLRDCHLFDENETALVSVKIKVIRSIEVVVETVDLDSKINKKPVTELHLSNRARRVLDRAGITNVGILRISTILSLRNKEDCGWVTIAEIRRALSIECGGLTIDNTPAWDATHLIDLGLSPDIEERLRSVGITSVPGLEQVGIEGLETKISKSPLSIIKKRLKWLKSVIPEKEKASTD